MKRIVAQLGLITVLVILGVFLFISGKQHKVFIENKTFEEHKPLKVVEYTINGMEQEKVKKGKKKLANVKGTSHEIVIYFEKDGEQSQINKTFKMKPMDEALISIPGIIEGSENWIEYYRPKTKQKS